MGWMSGLMMAMVLMLAGCGIVAHGGRSADELSMVARREALRQQAATLVHSWQAGQMEQAQKQWKTLTKQLLPDEDEEVYFVPPLESAAFEAMRTFLEAREEKLADLTLTPVTPVPLTSEQAWLRQELADVLHEFGEGWDVELPDEFVQEVEKALDFYTQDESVASWYRLAMERMDKYMPSIQGVFSQRDLPESFFYLALVESAFNPNAVSKSGPAGLWQLMPGTGRKYGLISNRKRDERKDPVKSSQVASEYLQDLLLTLGDSQSMLLAIAAYNAGEGRILSLLGALDEGSDRNFWSLFHKGLLPNTTKTLIARVMAAAVIGHNRERFGLAPGIMPEITTRLVLYQPVPIPYLLTVGSWEREELERLNPDLEEAEIINPDASGFELALPRQVARRLRGDAVLISAMNPPMAEPPTQ